MMDWGYIASSVPGWIHEICSQAEKAVWFMTLIMLFMLQIPSMWPNCNKPAKKNGLKFLHKHLKGLSPINSR